MKEKGYQFTIKNPKDTAEEIAAKLNTLYGALNSSVIKDTVSKKDFEDLKGLTTNYISGASERYKINTSDLRWHGGGLSQVTTDSTLTGKGTTASPLSVVGGGGSGTVTTVSVTSANGFGGSVANPTTTPAITLTTSVTGLLKGNGTSVSAATSGSDYAPATSGSSVLKGNGAGGFTNSKVTLTDPATSATLTIADGKTLTISKTLTLDGTDSTTMTFPSTSATIARTDSAQTFTGSQTFSQVLTTSNAIAASGNAATVPVTSKVNTVTNNSAATLTVTLATSGAIDGQSSIVRILDATGAAQTITWVNTENSTVSAPTTSNGSTTLPLTVGFMFNNNTSKFRCVASS